MRLIPRLVRAINPVMMRIAPFCGMGQGAVSQCCIACAAPRRQSPIFEPEYQRSFELEVRARAGLAQGGSYVPTLIASGSTRFSAAARYQQRLGSRHRRSHSPSTSLRSTSSIRDKA